MKSTYKLPKELAELSFQALQAGHKIKLCSLLPPIPSQEEIAEEADLWEIADEIDPLLF